MSESKMKTAGGNFPSNTQKSVVSTFGIDNDDGILDLTELLNNGYEIVEQKIFPSAKHFHANSFLTIF